MTATPPVRPGIGATPKVDQPRSMANRPIRKAPISVGNRMMRPAASQAASPEPIAIEIEKIARQVSTTSSAPPSTFLTSGTSNPTTTAPTSQNQLVTMAPHQMRRSSRRCLRRSQVEAAMFQRTTRPGAASPVGGMSRLAPQQAARTRSSGARTRSGRRRPWPPCPPTMSAEQDGDEGRAFDQRIAGRQLGAGEMVGQNAVFDRPEQRADHPEQEQREEQDRHRMEREASDRDDRDADLGELEPLGDPGLVETVRDLAAQRREEEIRRDEYRRRQRVSASAAGPAISNNSRKTSAFLRKLSLNAEKNWHQNSGAKRRVSSRDEDMGCIRSIDRARWPMRRAILERWSAENGTGCASVRPAARRPDGAPRWWRPRRPSERPYG